MFSSSDHAKLAQLRTEHAALRLEWELLKLKFGLGRKYDPDQPRVPAGNPDGGQWTNGNDEFDEGAGGGGSGDNSEQLDQIAARRISPALEAQCMRQYDKDIFQCRMVGLRACYAQASLRLANCLAGLPIPPLKW